MKTAKLSIALSLSLVALIPAGIPGAFAESRSHAHYERPSSRGGPYKERVIVFVHGIFGDADSTWRYSPNVYWPKLLLADPAFRDSDIYVASYSSPYLGNTMNIDDIVTNLNSRLESDEVFSKHREVVFVCHSLGGLIVQRLLLTFPTYSKQVPFIYFFSTPQTGASIVSLAAMFDDDPLLKAMIPGDQNEYLQNLENEWKGHKFQIRRFCAYETKKYKGVQVVDRLSGTRNCDEPPISINENHIGIVKPDGPEHASYIALRNAITKMPIAPRRVPARGLPGPEKPTAPVPSASEIAEAVAARTRNREAFEHEREQPIVGMYAILSLSKPLYVNELTDAAAVVEIADTIDEKRPTLSFGFRPDSEEWHEISAAGDRPLPMNGMRSRVWVLPKELTQETVAQDMDTIFVYRFNWLDRLEAGATAIKVPFSKVSDLDHASIQLKATENLVDSIQSLSLVVNDYVIFELTKPKILGWKPPAPPLTAQVTNGHLESGKLVVDQVVKTATLDPNDFLPRDFRKFSFFTAVVSPMQPGLNADSEWSPIKLSEFDVRIHHVMGGVFNHKAGNESRMIEPGEHGWLPAEPLTRSEGNARTFLGNGSQPHTIHVTSERNEFRIPHHLGCVPSYAEIQMTSRGLMQWQGPSKKYDGTYLYLDASDDGLTADILVWCQP